MATYVGTTGADTYVGTKNADSITGDAGNDTLSGANGSDTIFGGDGSDLLYGGSGNDTVDGGNDNDTIDGGTNADSLTGGSGDDTFNLTGTFGADTIVGGETGETTADTINASTLTTGVTVTYSGAEAGTITDGTSTATFSQIENLVLTTMADTVNASASTGSVNVDAGAGMDTLTGGSASDSLTGGSGSDSIFGGAGNDLLTGSEASAGTGTGTLSWSSLGDGTSVAGGASVSSGGLTVGVVYTDTGAGTSATVDTGSTLYTAPTETFNTTSSLWLQGTGAGPTSNVTLNFSATAGGGTTGTATNVSFRIDDIDAGNFQDIVSVFAYDALGNLVPVTITVSGSGAFVDTVSGNTVTAGNEANSPSDANGSALVTIAGPVSQIVIVYSNGLTNTQYLYVSDVQYTTTYLDDDSLAGGIGDDTVYGGIGNDSITGDAGNDLLYGGADNDTVSGGTDNDTVNGDAGNDLLTGDAGNDLLFGGNGNDTVSGGTDADTVNGDAGNDQLAGDAGNDLLSGGTGNDTMSGGADNDTLDGGTGNDVLTGDGGDDSFTLTGTFGNDTITGGETSETSGDVIDASGLTANTTVTFSGAEAGTITDGTSTASFSQIEALQLGAGNDTVNGGAGNDSVDAGAGNDLLFGGAGNDSFAGGAGNDTLDGGTGADTLVGGDGEDLFYGGVSDQILGGDGTDILDLTAYGHSGTNILYGGGNNQSGTVQFLDANGAIIGSLSFSGIEQVIACFASGTLISTDRGEMAIETIVPGDRVLTRDSHFAKVIWAGNRHLTQHDLLQEPSLRPVLIAKGALGQGLPMRELLVSPQHRILWTGARAELLFGEAEVLIAAVHLTGQPGISQICPKAGVTYHHVMFDRHEILCSEGTWSESFQPGAATLGGLDDDQRGEILALFPELGSNPAAYPAARPSLKRQETHLLLAG